MRISDLSSDVCSSDLGPCVRRALGHKIGYFLYLLAFSVRQDENGLSADQDQQVLDAYRGDGGSVRMDQRAFRAERQDIAGEGSSLRILVAEVVDRIPAADIGLAHVDLRDRHTISRLDDGIAIGKAPCREEGWHDA